MRDSLKRKLKRIIIKLPFGSQLLELRSRIIFRRSLRSMIRVKKCFIKRMVKDLWRENYNRNILSLDKFKSHSQIPLEEAVAFEIGAGQLLMASIGLSLFGFKKIIAMDISKTESGFVDLVIKQYRKHAKKLGIKSVPKIEEKINDENLDRILLQKFNIDHRAPYDAAHTDLPDNSVDYVYSICVFEHIRADVLPNIVKESYRILNAGGLQYALVDYQDHRTYNYPDTYNPDVTTIYDYLQYNQAEWVQEDSKYGLHQNRLRTSDYEAMFTAAGFEIVEVEKFGFDDADRAAFATVKVAAEFKNKYSDEELMERGAHFILRKPLNG